MELLKVDSVSLAREKLLSNLKTRTAQTMHVRLCLAQNYILANNIIATEPVPAFRRSTVDGYAVRANDTSGASEGLPVFLEIAGEVMMGSDPGFKLDSGQCAYVPTGGMIPEGADAMVMVEFCELFEQRQAAVYSSTAPGRHIVMVGEDIRQGELVLRRGVRIRPQEIGVLASLGITEVEVYKPWKITIISTGDELVPPDVIPTPGQIRDINTYSLTALAVKQGFEIRGSKVLTDNEDELREAIMNAMQECDVVIVSGGSSQGKKDATKKIIDEIASSGVLTHGLALRPGKPTILGYDEGTDTLLTGLPGHPVAAILVFEMLINWLWKQLTKQPADPSVFARITSNLAGAPGRTTCQLVRLIRQGNEYYAEPIFGKSGLITTLTRADGYILIDQNKEGMNKDEIVEVFSI
jgi:molybdopterin molybdotransferase